MLKIDCNKFLMALAKAEMTATKLRVTSSVGRNTISKVMNGGAKVRPETAGKLAKALHVEVEQLVDLQ